MTRKPFDRRLYAKYDELAKGFVRKLLEPLGYEVCDNPRKTAVDLIVKLGGETLFYVECEIKKALQGGKFKYDTVNIPERKRKYCGLKHPTLFMLFSPDGVPFILVWDKFVSRSNVEEVHNRHMRNGEEFFKVPIKDTDSDISKALRRKWRRKTE